MSPSNHEVFERKYHRLIQGYNQRLRDKVHNFKYESYQCGLSSGNKGWPRGKQQGKKRNGPSYDKDIQPQLWSKKKLQGGRRQVDGVFVTAKDKDKSFKRKKVGQCVGQYQIAQFKKVKVKKTTGFGTRVFYVLSGDQPQ